MVNTSGLVLSILGLLVFGALNTLTTKLQFDMMSVGSNPPGVEKLFRKPWFGTFTMFVGMSALLLPHFAMERKNRKVIGLVDDTSQPLLIESSAAPSEFTAFLYIGIPAMFDLVGSGLMFFGLLFISASVWQMLRGSMIVFGAIISVGALGRRLYAYHWLGVLICVAGIVAVATSNVFNESAQPATGHEGNSGQSLYGMGMVVAGQVVTASQMVAEEKLLKDVKLPAMKIVGYEGVWGSLVCMFVVFPICYSLGGEDALDSVVMVENSTPLLCLVITYIFSCATYNFAGMTVTSQLSAVHRTMLEATRTAGIWAIDLFVYYCVPGPKPGEHISFGEAWMPYSWLQLLGFGLLVVGQLVYSEVIRVPFFYYPPPAPTTGQQWASPAAMRSPFPLAPPEAL
jgi:drug/metabolite transporter (DMT)-like permease